MIWMSAASGNAQNVKSSFLPWEPSPQSSAAVRKRVSGCNSSKNAVPAHNTLLSFQVKQTRHQHYRKLTALNKLCSQRRRLPRLQAANLDRSDISPALPGITAHCVVDRAVPSDRFARSCLSLDSNWDRLGIILPVG